MTTTKASGRTITVGELRGHLAELVDNDALDVQILGDTYEITEVDGTLFRTINGDDDPAQEAYDVLEELRKFQGTKKAMQKLIADYFGD